MFDGINFRSFTFLFDSSCSSTCPSSSMFVDSNSTCQQCDSSCSTCTNTSTLCTSCNISGSLPFFYNDSCVSNCPQLYFLNSSASSCELCSSLALNCSNCSSETACFSCDSNYYFFPDNSSCIAEIPSGYAAVNGTLTPCDPSCATCTIEVTNCSSCDGNLSLFSNSCIDVCPNLTVAVNNTCTECSYPCLDCSLSPSACTSCLSNSSLFFDSLTNSCVDSSFCPNGTYPDLASSVCSSCNSSILRSACLLPCNLRIRQS